jgi:hypothetical protein
MQLKSTNSAVSDNAEIESDGTRVSTNLLGLDGFKEVIVPKEKPRNMTSD